MSIIKANTEVAGRQFLIVSGESLYTGYRIFNGGVVANNLELVVVFFIFQLSGNKSSLQ